MDKQIPTATFGVACSFDMSDEDSYGDDFVPPIFFVTFNTKDEEEALALAKCFCGTREAAKLALLILDKDGRIW